MLKPVDEPLIHALRLDAPYRIADIGCGGGGTTLEISRHAGVTSVVHGFDISEGLVEIARVRAREVTNIAFHAADMMIAPPPSELYDRLASRFGVMFFDEPGAAFSNLIEWLRPGGRFAFAVWGPASENPWTTLAREIVAEIVDLPAQDPDAPGPFRYGDASKLVSVLGRAGFADVEVNDWRGKLPIGGGLSAAAAADFALTAFASFHDLLSAAGGDAFRRASEKLTSKLATHEHDGIVQVAAYVHVVTGVRPKAA